jgi:hypothetical protein
MGSRWRVCAAALIVSLGWLLAGPAAADRRVALVVGNSAYLNVPRLANPANDARLMADTLRSLGFTLIGGGALLDLDKPRLEIAVQNFGNQLQGADVALFYYAGHGLQVRGANYLVPVGANPTKEADVDFQMLDAALVLRQMESAGTRLNLVILDACRNNPFGGRGLRSAGSGLAQMRAPEGTLISFATQPNNVAQDGVGSNSPYTKALTQTILQPGLGIFEVFNEVGLAVMQATGDAQQPWVSASPIRGNFYFAGPGSAASLPAPAATADEIAWGFLKNTTDLAALRQFLSQFPASVHGAEAQARIVSLEGATPRQPSADEHRQAQTGPDDIDARINAMVGPPAPLPDPMDMFAARPPSPPSSLPSDDIGRRIDQMVALPPMNEAPIDLRTPSNSGSRPQPAPTPLSRASMKLAAAKFASACAACHRSIQAIPKTRKGPELAEFLRTHYTASPDEAGLLAAYLARN